MNTINDINKKVCNNKNRLNSLSIILIFFAVYFFEEIVFLMRAGRDFKQFL